MPQGYFMQALTLLGTLADSAHAAAAGHRRMALRTIVNGMNATPLGIATTYWRTANWQTALGGTASACLLQYVATAPSPAQPLRIMTHRGRIETLSVS